MLRYLVKHDRTGAVDERATSAIAREVLPIVQIPSSQPLSASVLPHSANNHNGAIMDPFSAVPPPVSGHIRKRYALDQIPGVRAEETSGSEFNDEALFPGRGTHDEVSANRRTGKSRRVSSAASSPTFDGVEFLSSNQTIMYVPGGSCVIDMDADELARMERAIDNDGFTHDTREQVAAIEDSTGVLPRAPHGCEVSAYRAELERLSTYERVKDRQELAPGSQEYVTDVTGHTEMGMAANNDAKFAFTAVDTSLAILRSAGIPEEAWPSFLSKFRVKKVYVEDVVDETEAKIARNPAGKENLPFVWVNDDPTTQLRLVVTQDGIPLPLVTIVKDDEAEDVVIHWPRAPINFVNVDGRWQSTGLPVPETAAASIMHTICFGVLNSAVQARDATVLLPAHPFGSKAEVRMDVGGNLHLPGNVQPIVSAAQVAGSARSSKDVKYDPNVAAAPPPLIKKFATCGEDKYDIQGARATVAYINALPATKAKEHGGLRELLNKCLEAWSHYRSLLLTAHLVLEVKRAKNREWDDEAMRVLDKVKQKLHEGGKIAKAIGTEFAEERSARTALLINHLMLPDARGRQIVPSMLGYTNTVDAFRDLEQLGTVVNAFYVPSYELSARFVYGLDGSTTPFVPDMGHKDSWAPWTVVRPPFGVVGHTPDSQICSILVSFAAFAGVAYVHPRLDDAVLCVCSNFQLMTFTEMKSRSVTKTNATYGHVSASGEFIDDATLQALPPVEQAAYKCVNARNAVKQRWASDEGFWISRGVQLNAATRAKLSRAEQALCTHSETLAHPRQLDLVDEFYESVWEAACEPNSALESVYEHAARFFAVPEPLSSKPMTSKTWSTECNKAPWLYGTESLSLMQPLQHTMSVCQARSSSVVEEDARMSADQAKRTDALINLISARNAGPDPQRWIVGRTKVFELAALCTGTGKKFWTHWEETSRNAGAAGPRNKGSRLYRWLTADGVDSAAAAFAAVKVRAATLDRQAWAEQLPILRASVEAHAARIDEL
jgi:hypothetical protein